jgi:hypothetical protein
MSGVLKLKLYALVIVAFALGVLGIRSMWIQQGEDRLRSKIERERLDAALKAKEIENEVEALDRDAVRRRGKLWVRKSSR